MACVRRLRRLLAWLGSLPDRRHDWRATDEDGRALGVDYVAGEVLERCASCGSERWVPWERLPWRSLR